MLLFFRNPGISPKWNFGLVCLEFGWGFRNQLTLWSGYMKKRNKPDHKYESGLNPFNINYPIGSMYSRKYICIHLPFTNLQFYAYIYHGKNLWIKCKNPPAPWFFSSPPAKCQRLKNQRNLPNGSPRYRRHGGCRDLWRIWGQIPKYHMLPAILEIYGCFQQ